MGNFFFVLRNVLAQIPVLAVRLADQRVQVETALLQDGAEQPVPGQDGELTVEEKEQQQRIENLMRKVPDDPAFLLKRKMQLEAQKRQRQRMPSNRSDW